MRKKPKTLGDVLGEGFAFTVIFSLIAVMLCKWISGV